MIRFENEIDIGRSPDEVYAYLADLEHTPEWNWAIKTTQKLTPGPVRIGTRYRQIRSVPQPAVEILEVVGLDPGRSIEIAGSVGPFRAHLSYEVSATPDGARLVNLVELSPPPPLGVLGSIVGSRVASAVAANLDVLRQLLEEGSATPRPRASEVGAVPG